MAIKLQHNDTYATYFITFTCAEWIPLFEITNSYDLVYKWFLVLQKKYNANVVAYVIMPIIYRSSCIFILQHSTSIPLLPMGSGLSHTK